jgi:hypothetical protein
MSNTPLRLAGATKLAQNQAIDYLNANNISEKAATDMPMKYENNYDNLLTKFYLNLKLIPSNLFHSNQAFQAHTKFQHIEQGNNIQYLMISFYNKDLQYGIVCTKRDSSTVRNQLKPTAPPDQG